MTEEQREKLQQAFLQLGYGSAGDIAVSPIGSDKYVVVRNGKCEGIYDALRNTFED